MPHFFLHISNPTRNTSGIIAASSSISTNYLRQHQHWHHHNECQSKCKQGKHPQGRFNHAFQFLSSRVIFVLPLFWCREKTTRHCLVDQVSEGQKRGNKRQKDKKGNEKSSHKKTHKNAQNHAATYCCIFYTAPTLFMWHAFFVYSSRSQKAVSTTGESVRVI